MAQRGVTADTTTGVLPTVVEARVNALAQAAAQTIVDALVAGAPAALNTLDELAAALADDASFAASVTTALAGKVSTGTLTTALAAKADTTALTAGLAGKVDTTTLDALKTTLGETRVLVGLSELGVSRATAGTAIQQQVSVTFDGDGVTPFDIEVSGGSYTASVASAVLTWDLYDNSAQKVIRQAIRSAPATANVVDDIPALARRRYVFPAGRTSVYLRVKPAANTVLTMLNALSTGADESPLQIAAYKAVLL